MTLPNETGTVCTTGSVCSGYQAAGTTTLQDAYDAGSAGDQVVQLTTANDSIIFRNPSSSGSDSAYVLTLDQLSTGTTGGLSIQSAGTGNLLLVTDTTATARDVLTIADGGATTFRNQTDSMSAFVIQNAAGSSNLFVADTQNTRIGIGITPSSTLDVNGNITLSGNGVARTISGPTNQNLIISTGNTNDSNDGISFKIDYDNSGATNFQDALTVRRNGLFFQPVADPIYIQGPDQRSLTLRTGDANDTGDEVGIEVDTNLSGSSTYTRVLTADPGNGGSIGIGTASPSAKLQVSSSDAVDLFKVTDATSSAVDVLNIADEGAATFRNRTDSTTAFQIQNAAGTSLFNVDTSNSIIRPGIAPDTTTATRTTTEISDAGDTGYETSTAIGADGLPIISHQIFSTRNLIVTKCGNDACSSGNTSTELTTSDDDGYDTSIAIGADGLPVIGYGNATDFDLNIVHCGNAACSSGNTTTELTNADTVGYWTDIAIGTDGLPVISHFNDTDNDLNVTKCGNAACSSGNTTTELSTADDDGYNTSIAIGNDGLPVISYYNATDFDLNIVHCGNAACSSGNTTTELSTVDADAYTSTSIAIGTDGLPVISYGNYTDKDINVVKCGNAACSSGNTTTELTTADDDDSTVSIAIDSDGLPVMAYKNFTDSYDVNIVHCGNAACSVGNITTELDTLDFDGSYISVAIGSDGLPVISHQNGTDFDLNVTKCADVTCSATSGNALTSGVDLGTSATPWRSIYTDTINLGDQNARLSLDNSGNFHINGLSVSGTTAVNVRNSVDSTTAFQIQNAAGGSLFSVDTVNKSININATYTPDGWNPLTTTVTTATGNSGSYNATLAQDIYVDDSVTGNGGNEAYGTSYTLQSANDAWTQNLYGENISLETHNSDGGTGILISNVNNGSTSTGGQQYGLYLDLNDADVNSYGIYQAGSVSKNYFGGSTTFKSEVNSTTAFQIQNAAGASQFNFNTTGSVLTIKPTGPTYVGGANNTGDANSVGGSTNDFNDVAASGHNIYIAKGGNSTACSGTPNAVGCELQVYDSTNAGSPKYLGGADAEGTTNSGGGASTFTTVATAGHLVAIGKQGDATTCQNSDGNAGGCEIQIYDVSNPSSPTLIGAADSSGSSDSGTSNIGVNSLAFSGNYLYVAKSGNGGTCSASAGNAPGCELMIFDISSPANPRFVGGADSDGNTNSGATADDFNDIKVSGGYAYVGQAQDPGTCSATGGSAIGCEFKVFNISNPTSPTYVGGADADGTTNGGDIQRSLYGLDISGNYAYTAWVADSNSCNPTPGNSLGCELKVFDISNPAAPTEIAVADADGTTNGGGTGDNSFGPISVNGSLLIVGTDGDGGTCSATEGSAVGCELLYFDVSDPTSLAYLGGADADGTTNGGSATDTIRSIAVSGGQLYVGKSGSGTNCSSAVGCELQVYNTGGIIAPSAQIGNTETGSLTVTGGGMVAGDFNIQGSATIAQNAFINGNLSVAGSSIVLNSGNNGVLADFVEDTTTLPSGINKAYFDALVANGYMYVIGGWDGTTFYSSAHYAPINADGSVGTWTATSSLSTTRASIGAIYASGYIYVMGGDSGGNPGNTVEYAKVNSDGTLGSWQTSANNMSTAVNSNSKSTVYHNGYIYIVGGQTAGSISSAVVQRAKVLPGGGTGPWSATTPLPTQLNYSDVAIANGYIYAVGGYHSQVPAGRTSAVYYAPLNADGSVGAWTTATNNLSVLSSPNDEVEQAAVYVMNGYIYATGGKDSLGDSSDDTMYAKLNADGSVGVWSVIDGHLGGNSRYAQALADANGYVYILGGRSSGPDTFHNNIYYASSLRVSVGGSLDLVGLNGGTLAEGGTGGSLTAGNTQIVGTLGVAGNVQFAQNLQVGGDIGINGGVAIGSAGSLTGQIVLNNSSNSNTITLASGTTSASYSLTLPTAVGSANECLKNSATPGVLVFGSCGGSPSAVELIPEYPGAVLTGDGSSNSGTMSTDFCSGTNRVSVNTGLCSADEEHNYYSWTTSQATDQDYTIYVRYKLTAATNDTSSTFTVNGWRTDATNNSVNVSIFNASGDQCGATTNVATGTATWSPTTIGSVSGDAHCDMNANDVIVFKIFMTASQNDFARVGEIGVNY